MLVSDVKKIGFLSFGHWTDHPESGTRNASDALLQAIDLAVAAEELGANGAYFRVHHFAQQYASPFPLLAAIGGTDQPHRDRYRRDRHALREPALHGGGRPVRPTSSRAADCSWVSAGVHPSRSSRGGRHFGFAPARGRVGRRHGPPAHRAPAPKVLTGQGLRGAEPPPDVPWNPPGLAARGAVLGMSLRERIWWGSGSNATAVWAGEARHEPAKLYAASDDERQQSRFTYSRRSRSSSTGRRGRRPVHRRGPRVSVSRSIFALTEERDWKYFGWATALSSLTRWATSTRKPAPSFGRSTRAPRTNWPRSWPRTRRSPGQTPC